MISVSFTGLDRLAARLHAAPRQVEEELSAALGRGLLMAETEAKRRTPVATGYLRSSIGGVGGYRFVHGLVASVGTNVKYAIYVHQNEKARHNVGESKFMEKGAQAAVPFIQSEIEKVAGKIAVFITS